MDKTTELLTEVLTEQRQPARITLEVTMLRKGTVVKSKQVGCVESFVGVIEEVLRTHKKKRYYHVRDRNTGVLWHRDPGDLSRYRGGKNVRRARTRRDSVRDVGCDPGVVTP